MTPEEIIMMIKERLLSLYRGYMNGQMKQAQIRIDELERLLMEITEEADRYEAE